MSTMWMEEEIHDQGWQKSKIKEKKAQPRSDINIGKKGITDPIICEIIRRLEEEGVVKIRVLKSALTVSGLDRREFARMVARKTGALLVEVRGRTFILAKPLDKGRKEKGTVYKKHKMFKTSDRRGLRK